MKNNIQLFVRLSIRDMTLDALERFLLDRLQPRTFDDFSEIDALLDEGGVNA
jgi:hypothetical protein